ncbi:hypothetical protein C8Q75DRAFT_786548 [Abortiporus biennis]|nr:hypothetical protein C8Q75DRAFT_786548 [Abortiporus biennis]
MGITAEIGVNVPILGYKKLAHIAGDLVKGVETAFNLFGVASGSARVFLQGKNVMCELKASILSKNYNNTFKIFSLP